MFVCIVADTNTKTLLPIIKDKVVPDSIVFTDSYKSCDVLDVSAFKHFRINHNENFVDSKNHINGIENSGRPRNETSGIMKPSKTTSTKVQWNTKATLSFIS